MRILKTMDGAHIPLNDEQAEVIIKAIEDGVKNVRANGSFIRTSAISGVYESHHIKEGQRKGRLHDGLKVVKKFGRWELPDRPNVSLDPEHYPEIAKDEVMTEEEWQAKQKQLSK